jgi:outer membrane immunogenic protein
MKKLVICIAAAAALAAGPAGAADMPLPTKAPPVVAAWSWAGFYIGGHGGYGWKTNDFLLVENVTPLAAINGIDSKGWVGGAQAGYNWQFGAWVAGLELDGSATGISGFTSTGPFGAVGAISQVTRGDDVKMLGTARARVGYAVAPGCCWNLLFYGTGGLAWERFDRSFSSSFVSPGFSQAFFSSNRRDLFGWVAGAGIEAQIANSNWIARAEYLHYEFGNTEGQSSQIVNGVAQLNNSGGSQTIDMVRGAISYKFTPGT